MTPTVERRGPGTAAAGSQIRLKPPVDLRGRVRIIGTGPLEDRAVREAERALGRLSGHFEGWMKGQVDALVRAHAASRAHGFGAEVREALFRAAHDLRGHAATLGYPQAGHIAGSLARLLELAPRPDRIPADLVAFHVDGVRAVVEEGADSPLAQALADELDVAVGRFLAA